ncbi:phBC6A51 family helix-turn-helix protein [Alteribacter populi]|uniref:phBC6A51 family helix-turn-helix protein n=1 Tax=Alteribacter populi TaxID=2011011 RepID=UPI000BBB1B24|nr:phBC6A51 family helix-turn-helix protein [Alteribacter populi]
MAKKLSDKQYAAIALLSLPQRGGMTYEQIAEQVGIHRTTLHDWRRDDDFNAELKAQIMRSTLDRLPDIMASIPDHIIEDGNAALFRTLLQAHGMLTEKHEVEAKGSGQADMDAIRAKIQTHRDTQT